MDLDSSTPAGTRVNIIVLAFTLVSGLIVFLRLFTRLVISKGAGLEDACIVVAMILSVALAVLTAEQVMNGLGEHKSRLELNEQVTLRTAFWASVWVYNLTLAVTKISILVQYLRIFPVRGFRIACYAMLSIVILYGGWATFSSVFVCSPVAFSWDKSIDDGRCVNQLIIWVVNAGVNIAQDVVIFLMPLSIVRALHLPKSQKEGLVAVFVLGASVTMVSIIRLYTLDNIANSTDISFDNVDHATLSAVEVNVGIICACIPAMRPLFALLAPHYFSAVPQYTNARILDIERQKQRTGRQGNTRPTTATPRTRPNTARTTIIRPTTTTTTTTRTRPSTVRTTMTGPGTATHVTRPSTARTTTRSSTSHTLKLETTIPRADSVQSGIPLQPLVPTLSRTPSGRFSVANSSRPPTLRLPSYNNHSRNASGSSQSTQSSTRGRSATRFQGRPDPLRMSPITPFSPPWPAPLRTGSPLALGSHARPPSSQRAPSPLPPRTPGADKQLPLTPFPVGSVD